MALLPSLFLFSAFITTSVAQAPRLLEWSSKTYGPDGPWRAVSVSIGTPKQAIDLYPGSTWQSQILASSICENVSLTTCFAGNAGTYDSSASSTHASFEVPLGESHAIDWTLGAMPMVGTDGFQFDELTMDQGQLGEIVIANLSMNVITSVDETLPGGRTFKPQVGILALGASDDFQQFSQGIGKPMFNASLLPNSMYSQDIVGTNSFGLHIGSAAMGIPGSLYIGGYDQTRIVGNVTSQVYGGNFFQIDLLDIGIGVAEGTSPFSFTSKSGLLASGNSSIGSSMPINIDASVPYMYLPESTCKAISTNLPVVYNENLGLYLWNTQAASYESITSSPSFIQFTFRLNNSNSLNVTINVPFRLLNLTLDTPLVDTPTPYFPCRPSQSSTNTLGRAFLQAAFLGANWNKASPGNFWIAQAPGPTTPSTPSVKNTLPTDGTVYPSSNEWITSWKDHWIVLDSPTPSINSTADDTTTTNSPSSPGNSTNGTPAKTIIGAGVGVGVPLILSIAALLSFWRRRKHQAAKSSRDTVECRKSYHKSELSGESQIFGTREMVYDGRPKEMEGGFSVEAVELHGVSGAGRKSWWRRTNVYEMP